MTSVDPSDHTGDGDDIESLRARVYWLRPDAVIMYREVPTPSPARARVLGEKLRELTSARGPFSMIMDLSEAAPPNRATRKALRDVFGELRNLQRVVVFTGRNILISTVAKLVLKRSGVRNLELVKNEALAVAALERSA